MAFPQKAPDEIKLLTFDFTRDIATGTTLSNPTISAALLEGPGTAGDLTLSILGLSGFIVSVLAYFGLEGATYRLTCEVDASNGEHHDIIADLPISVAGPLVLQ